MLDDSLDLCFTRPFVIERLKFIRHLAWRKSFDQRPFSLLFLIGEYPFVFGSNRSVCDLPLASVFKNEAIVVRR